MKIACYGVQPLEKPYFENLNKIKLPIEIRGTFGRFHNASPIFCDRI